MQHKSKSFRSILDLLFSLKLTPRGRVPSVNENIDKTATGVAIGQIEHVLLRLIHAFDEAPDCENIFQENGISKMGFGGYIVKKFKNGIFVMSYHRSQACQ